MRFIPFIALSVALACVAPTPDTSAGQGEPHGHEHEGAHGHSHDADVCTCARAVLDNTWCGEHGQGYAYTQLITSRVLFDAVDAHGHDFDRDVMQCVACKRMMDTGGFCEDCRFGWVDGQAYMSRLTYHLALGEARDVTSLACASCRDLVGTVGSCEGCSGAWVGNVFFVDPNDHEAAVHEFERLQVATEVSARCETCAMLVLVDGKCPYCKVEYFDGTRLRAPQ